MLNIVAYRRVSSLYVSRECIVFLLKRLKIARIEAAVLEILTAYMSCVIGMLCNRISIFKADPGSIVLALARLNAGFSQSQLGEAFKQSMELAATPSTSYDKLKPQSVCHLLSPNIFKNDCPLSPNITK